MYAKSHSRWLSRAGWLGCVAAILAAGPALRAQDVEIELVDDGQVQAVPAKVLLQAEAQPRNFWIGLICQPADEALRSHLGLEANHGLVVQETAKDSPAAKAGLQPHDVVTKVGDKALASIDDLVQIVESSEGKELSVELIRKGQKTTVQITPIKPPEQIARFTPAQAIPPEVIKWFQKGNGPGQFRMHMVQPGVIAPEFTIETRVQALPADLSITVTRKGEESARISVTKGDKKWDITEDKINELPEDVRPHVERMLGRPTFTRANNLRLEGRLEKLDDVRKRFPQAVEAIKGFERQVAPPGDDNLKKEMAEIKSQLEDLKKAVEALKKPE